LRVAGDDVTAAPEAKLQPGFFGLADVVQLQAPEDVSDRERLGARLDRTGIELREVEDGAERLVEGLDRPHHVVDERLLRRVRQAPLERGAEEAERMQRLAQVVTRRRQELARLPARPGGELHLLVQPTDEGGVLALRLAAAGLGSQLGETGDEQEADRAERHARGGACVGLSPDDEGRGRQRGHHQRHRDQRTVDVRTRRLRSARPDGAAGRRSPAGRMRIGGCDA
jgi:hypothetical protein